MKFDNLKLILASLLISSIVSCNSQPPENELSKAEVKAGWILMFDGTSTEGWRGYNQSTIPEGWKVMDGTLMSTGEGGDIGGDIIFEKEEYCDFELKLEWKISAGGNSGILYHAVEGPEYLAVYETAPEYQLIDDIGFPEELMDWQKTGADYAMYLADSTRKNLYPAGEWNISRIVFNNGHVEHWLNGEKIVEFDAWSDDWNQKVKEGKWNNYPDYGKSKCGYIALQDHGSFIWFRNIKIRPFP